VDYPLEGSVFPPEFPPPRLEWRDPSKASFELPLERERFGVSGVPLEEPLERL
jgi:hypothetical protein